MRGVIKRKGVSSSLWHENLISNVFEFSKQLWIMYNNNLYIITFLNENLFQKTGEPFLGWKF